jgi:hypothetical protein
VKGWRDGLESKPGKEGEGVWYGWCHEEGVKEGGPVRCGSTGGVW